MKAMLSRLRGLRCLFWFHKLKLQRHIKGNHDELTWIAAFTCQRCGCRFIMSDEHQAFLRYDNDGEFKADITRI
jgi:hypothetical protein